MNWDFSPHILIQGINQPEAISYLQKSELPKKSVIAGVADEYIGDSIEDIPIFDLVTSVVEQKNKVVTSLVFSHPHHVLDSCYEAINAGIKQIVINSGKVSPLDLIKLYQIAHNNQVLILGPSGGGILKPGQYNCGVKNRHIFSKGNVGIINFAHQTIPSEIALSLKEDDLAISILINLGNDYFTKTNWDVWLKFLNKNRQTRSIVVIISQITPLEAEQLILALNQVAKKKVVIYLLDTDNWHDKINHRQAEVISDQIHTHLYPISAIKLIKECDFPENIIISENYAQIGEILTKDN